MFKIILNKIGAFFKRFWWVIALVFSLVFGMRLFKRQPVSPATKQLKEVQNDLENELKELKKQEQEIKNKTYFKNGDEAIKFLNKIIGSQQKKKTR